MRPPPTSTERLRLPKSLKSTALQLTMLATLSCRSEVTPPPPADAASDVVAADAVASDVAASDAGDACPQPAGCAAIRDGAVCPQEVCSEADCPAEAGCEFI